MRYLMFVATDPEAEPYDPAADDAEDWVAKHDASGQWVMGDRLRPVQDATTVRRRGGKVLVTDGPFAESREWIAGFDILECADLDEAIAVAAAHPMARFGRLELRPFWSDQDEQAGPKGRAVASARRRPMCAARSRTPWRGSGCGSWPG